MPNDLTLDDITPDGYIIVPKKTPEQLAKGQQCGECGARFDFGRAYSYVCYNNRCPLFPQITAQVQS